MQRKFVNKKLIINKSNGAVVSRAVCDPFSGATAVKLSTREDASIKSHFTH